MRENFELVQQNIFPKDHKTISWLMKCLPLLIEIVEEQTVIIDGVTAVISSHLLQEPLHFYYCNDAT